MDDDLSQSILDTSPNFVIYILIDFAFAKAHTISVALILTNLPRSIR